MRKRFSEIAMADLLGLIVRQGCATVAFPARYSIRHAMGPMPISVDLRSASRADRSTMAKPILLFGVGHVVQMRPEKQVIRSDARRVVTVVENQRASVSAHGVLWQRSIGQFPHHAMSTLTFPLAVSIGSSTVALPEPASIALLDEIHERLARVVRWSSTAEMMRSRHLPLLSLSTV